LSINTSFSNAVLAAISESEFNRLFAGASDTFFEPTPMQGVWHPGTPRFGLSSDDRLIDVPDTGRSEVFWLGWGEFAGLEGIAGGAYPPRLA
jgi:hypothetical protein